MAGYTASWEHEMVEYANNVATAFGSVAEAIENQREAMSGFSADNDYMYAYQTSHSIEQGMANLTSREIKEKNNPEYVDMWGDNPTALMEEINNKYGQMLETNTIEGILMYASQRQAKINWLSEHGREDLVEQYVDDLSTSSALINAAMFNSNISDYERTRLMEAIDAAGITSGSGRNIMDSDLNYIREYLGLATYDTGGFTGAFGDGGKLAILHEKELVLNQEDTSNLLRTMESLNSLINNI